LAQTGSVVGVDKLEAVASRGYDNSPEILACEEVGITLTLPKPMMSVDRGITTATRCRTLRMRRAGPVVLFFVSAHDPQTLVRRHQLTPEGSAVAA
jgi:hypothetical protein